MLPAEPGPRHISVSILLSLGFQHLPSLFHAPRRTQLGLPCSVLRWVVRRQHLGGLALSPPDTLGVTAVSP